MNILGGDQHGNRKLSASRVAVKLEAVNYEHSGSRGRDFKISFWVMPWSIGKTSFKRYVSSSFWGHPGQEATNSPQR